MTDLRLNFTPLALSGASIDFQTLPYRDRDQLSELRQDTWAGLLFYGAVN
jgi:hypothetical protein